MKKIVTSLFAVLLLVGLVQAKQATTKYEKALLEAAKTGNAAQVRGLLEAGTDPNVTDKDGNTPLIYAAKENLASVDMLLFAGADVNAKGENGITALINSFSIVTPEAKKIRERLLKAKPDVNAVVFVRNSWDGIDRTWNILNTIDDYSGIPFEAMRSPIFGSATALSFAVASGDISTVETLLKHGADVNAPLMRSVLATAIYSKRPNSTKIMERLLQAGADPWDVLSDVKDGSGITDRQQKLTLIKTAMAPMEKQHKLDEKLYESVKKGNLKKVKKLLEQGAKADVSLMAPLGSSKVDIEILKTLLDAGLDVNARNVSYSTPLFYNDFSDGEEKIKLLLKSGADIQARNMYGRTPLFGVASDQAQVLIQAGVDVNARDYEGISALFYAYMNDNQPLIERLQSHGATLSAYEKQRLALEKQKQEQRRAEYQAEKAASGNSGLGQTLLQGLLNAANDTANFAINSAGKF